MIVTNDDISYKGTINLEMPVNKKEYNFGEKKEEIIKKNLKILRLHYSLRL